MAEARPAWVRYAAAVVLTGLIAGLAGMVLALLLHLVQHLAFGYGLSDLFGGESFLDGVRQTPPLRRLVVLILCGAVAGGGWWLVYRAGRPLVSVKRAVADPSVPMPPGATLAHVLLQIVTVGMGSPLGREVAPREMGAMIAGWLARHLHLTPEDMRRVLACGAGAGLAAVYNVPLGATLFVLEVLLRSVDARAAVSALAACTIGAYVAWTGLGDLIPYHIPRLSMDPSLVAWAVLCGPFFGVMGLAFARLTASARKSALRGARMIPACLAAFTLTGLVSMLLPEILGNGKGPIQMGLEAEVGLRLALLLIVLKLGLIVMVLRAGAKGGLMTPGMTIGALAGLVLGIGWNHLTGVQITPGSFALVGAAALLSVSMNMPVTAIVLSIEFTRAGHDFFIPVILAVAGASATAMLLAGRMKAAQGFPDIPSPYQDRSAHDR
ncbi:MAG: chloride channel protein [Paracoccus sp. (in: a-proteobacteria)]|nr:chloride channel protein [Paracoccus sp. (in: a-proteobacteria)]